MQPGAVLLGRIGWADAQILGAVAGIWRNRREAAHGRAQTGKPPPIACACLAMAMNSWTHPRVTGSARLTKVTFFAFDIAEAAQIRRIEAVRSLGHAVASVSFRRANMNAGFQPDWPDLALGEVRNNDFLRRGLRVLASILRVWRQRDRLAGSPVWIARNFDLLAIAWAVKGLSGRRDVKLVYECLDIHGLFTRAGPVGGVMRWLERRLLGRIALLIHSSPGFERNYFMPVQQYAGPVALIENKLWIADRDLPRPERARQTGAPLVLGWVGSLRCRESLLILAEAARGMGEALRVELHGNVHAHAIPDFDTILSAHPNLRHHGAYRYPDDLAAIYQSCDLVWAQDLWQRGANSDWLLPNRIYEASYFGCPQVAVAGTETGRRVAEAGQGFVLPEASAAALVTLLRSLAPAAVTSASARLLATPDEAFRLRPSELAAQLAPVLPGGCDVSKPVKN